MAMFCTGCCLDLDVRRLVLDFELQVLLLVLLVEYRGGGSQMHATCGAWRLLIGVDHLTTFAFLLLNLIVFVTALQASGVLLPVGGCTASAHIQTATRMPADFLAVGLAAVHLSVGCGVALTLLDHACRRRVGECTLGGLPQVRIHGMLLDICALGPDVLAS